MRKIVVVSSACALVAINAAALLLLVGPLSTRSSDAVEIAVDTSAASQPAQLSVIPASDRPPGVTDMASALASVGATTELGSWPSWCGAPPEGPWKSFGVTVDGSHVAVVLASAGDGARLWQQQLLELTRCSQFNVVSSTPTSLTLRRTDVPVTWVVARHEDVFVSVLQATPTASPDALAAIASSVLAETAAQCQTTADESMTRNPWRAGYQPWHPADPIDTPDPGGPTVPVVAATVEWAAPVATPRPELAVLWKPNATYNPFTIDVALAPVRRLPVLVDPAEILPPAVPRPAAPPPVTVPMPTTATAYFAREDSVGPGCGWAFTGTVPPAFDPTLPAKELEGQIDGAFATAATDLASWLAWSVDAKAHAQEDAATRAALAAWAKYDDAFQKATVAWQAAVVQRSISLDAWYSYVPDQPLPGPTSTEPSTEPTEAPTVVPTASPVPTPTATGVR